MKILFDNAHGHGKLPDTDNFSCFEYLQKI